MNPRTFEGGLEGGLEVGLAVALADVAAAFGTFVADALKRAVLRDCAGEEEHPDAGRLRRSGRFAWFEASGPFFGKNRYALERGEVSWLPTPIYRDELRGASALLARYTPLTESDASALIVLLDAFGDGKIAFVRDERARHVSRGVFAADTRARNVDSAIDDDDDDDDDLAPRGRILVELATGVCSVEPAASDVVRASDAASTVDKEAMLLDDGLRAMLVSAHKNARKTTHATMEDAAVEERGRADPSSDLDDVTNVDAHPPIAAQRAAREASSNESSFDDATAVNDVDKTRRS